MQTRNTDFIHKIELDRAFFQHDLAYGKSNDLAKRTELDKSLRNKAPGVASNSKQDGYQRGLARGLEEDFLIKIVLVEQSKPSKMINFQMTFIDRLLENLRKEKFIHL